MSLALNYDLDKGRRDLVAGLTVAAIAVPEGMAYALIAGVDPKFGSLFDDRRDDGRCHLRLVVTTHQRADQRNLASRFQRACLS